MQNKSRIYKRISEKIVFFVPIIIILVGIITIFIIFPELYGDEIWFNMIFPDVQKFMKGIFTFNNEIINTSEIFIIRIFCYIWLGCFILSLFFVGRKFHRKIELNYSKEILTRKECYLLIQETNDILKQIKKIRNSKEFDAIIYDMKCLSEKIYSESEFSYENDAVFSCEHLIVQNLNELSDLVLDFEPNVCSETISTLNILILKINSLLDYRTELKKK